MNLLKKLFEVSKGISKIPEKLVNNHFFTLALLSFLFIVFALIYNAKYIIYGFISFVFSLICFLINIFYTKAVYRDNHRQKEFYKYFVLAAIWLIVMAVMIFIQ